MKYLFILLLTFIGRVAIENVHVESDGKSVPYVNQTTANIQANAECIIFKNIADFEREFDTYPLSRLDSLKNPDVLIMKISENVNDQM